MRRIIAFKRICTNPKSYQAMTLIEIIVALALIGIITVSILTLLSVGFKNVVNAGDKAEVLFNIQSTIEDQINQTTEMSGELSETFKLKVGDEEITMPGQIKSVESALPNGGKLKIDIFVPNK